MEKEHGAKHIKIYIYKDINGTLEEEEAASAISITLLHTKNSIH